MIPILNEEVQRIKCNKDKEVTNKVITNALLKARWRYHYARFYTNKYYIEVSFRNDGTVQISSNYRCNMVFNKAIKQLENKKYTIGNVTYFIWLWINRIRKL